MGALSRGGGRGRSGARPGLSGAPAPGTAPAPLCGHRERAGEWRRDRCGGNWKGARGHSPLSRGRRSACPPSLWGRCSRSSSAAAAAATGSTPATATRAGAGAGLEAAASARRLPVPRSAPAPAACPRPRRAPAPAVRVPAPPSSCALARRAAEPRRPEAWPNPARVNRPGPQYRTGTPIISMGRPKLPYEVGSY